MAARHQVVQQAPIARRLCAVRAFHCPQRGACAGDVPRGLRPAGLLEFLQERFGSSFGWRLSVHSPKNGEINWSRCWPAPPASGPPCRKTAPRAEGAGGSGLQMRAAAGRDHGRVGGAQGQDIGRRPRPQGMGLVVGVGRAVAVPGQRLAPAAVNFQCQRKGRVAAAPRGPAAGPARAGSAPQPRAQPSGRAAWVVMLCVGPAQRVGRPAAQHVLIRDKQIAAPAPRPCRMPP